jgi:hypothetical protein
MAQNLRQLISQDIVTVLKDQTDPRPVIVTTEPFQVTELAITQFPAILITATNETRETVSMGTNGRRSGTITFTIRAFVRGNELDKRRNEIIERIEETLDSDRYRALMLDGTNSRGIIDSQILTIDVIERQPPLAEVSIEYQVRYNYQRGLI